MNSRSDADYHEDSELFRGAIRFTSVETGFSERLIEKDYFCSMAIADLCASAAFGLVLKGGACLSKIHADFYRMSEDLDFCVSTPIELPRGRRSRSLDKLKKHLTELSGRRPFFRIAGPLKGFNHSTQYGGRLAYTSVVTGEEEFIKIEISVREPIIESPMPLPARTMLLDPFRGAPAVAAFATAALSLREAYAEKLRAALTRAEPAVRDFFDLDHAVSTGRIDLTGSQLIRLLRTKLSVPGCPPIDISPERLRRLRTQVGTQLRPVLRAADFERFDLDRAFGYAAKAAQMAGS